jgi:hypothetical protein
MLKTPIKRGFHYKQHEQQATNDDRENPHNSWGLCS